MRSSSRHRATAQLLLSLLCQRNMLRYIGLFVLLALLLGSSLFPSSASTATTVVQPQPSATPRMGCVRGRPRVVSHRGIDEDVAGGPAPATVATVSALLDDGFSSFDVDLYWAADDGKGDSLFVGHPPSLRKLWSLPDEVHALPIDKLAERAQAAAAASAVGAASAAPATNAAAALPRHSPMLSLADLCQLLASRKDGDPGTISLEVKFPGHPAWRRHVNSLYSQLANSVRDGSHESLIRRTKFAAVVGDHAQALAHREAQARVRMSVPLLLVVADAGAKLGPDGAPHANISALQLDAARADGLEGWSASIKLLDDGLRSAASISKRPLAVWTVDSEHTLRRAFDYGADDVVTNRPHWAKRTLDGWRRAECH